MDLDFVVVGVPFPGVDAARVFSPEEAEFWLDHNVTLACVALVGVLAVGGAGVADESAGDGHGVGRGGSRPVVAVGQGPVKTDELLLTAAQVMIPRTGVPLKGLVGVFEVEASGGDLVADKDHGDVGHRHE